MEYQAALKYYRAMQRKTAPGKQSKKAVKAKTKDPQRDSARREQGFSKGRFIKKVRDRLISTGVPLIRIKNQRIFNDGGG